MTGSLASVHPELIPEWSEKNLPLTPDKISSYDLSPLISVSGLFLFLPLLHPRDVIVAEGKPQCPKVYCPESGAPRRYPIAE